MDPESGKVVQGIVGHPAAEGSSALKPYADKLGKWVLSIFLLVLVVVLLGPFLSKILKIIFRILS